MLRKVAGLAILLFAPLLNGQMERRTELLNQAPRAVPAPARGA